MKSIIIGILAMMMVLSIATGGWGPEINAKPNAESESASWETDTMIEETTNVVAIDHSTRMVTLKSTTGKEFTFRAGKHIENLAQVEVGDEVKFSHHQSFAVRVLKKGETGFAVGEGGVVIRAKNAEKPAGFAMREKTILATIESIDKNAKTATLKEEGGKTVTVTPREPKRLDQVKVGDRLEITHTEEIAVKVEKVEKKR